MNSKVRSNTVQSGGGSRETQVQIKLFFLTYMSFTSPSPHASFRFALTAPSFIAGGWYSSFLSSHIFTVKD
jgi:hypothetical protein